MSVILYVVRQKKNKSLFYRARGSGATSGWVNDIEHASIYGTYQGPHQVMRIVGYENADIIAMTCLPQEGKYDTVYVVRHKTTGEFVANRKHRNRGIFYSKHWDDAGLWTRPQHVKAMIRAWERYCKHKSMLKYNLDIKGEELEIIKMPIFVPPMETI